MSSVWGELRRRNVVKVAVAYAIVGWLLVQVADVFFPALRLPDWTVTFVAALLILGFPIALLLSWAYELTPEGVKRANVVPLSESITRVTGRKLDFVIIGLLGLAVGFMFVDNYLPESGPFAGAEIDPASLGPDLDEDARIVPQATIPPAEEGQREVLPNSVAVLLCDNLSPNPDDAYIAASIHDEILNQLVKIRSMNVIAKTSVLQYAGAPPPISQIAEELNVESVLECSVRYAGDSILVTAQLIDPETNSHLWSDTYPGDMGDLSTIFAMQADIATSIANAVGAEFSFEERARLESTPTVSPAAYAFYLRATNAFYSEEGTGWNSEMDEAIALDPEFALAYATKAYFNAIALVGVGVVAPAEVAELERTTRTAAERALELDPALGLAQAALAALHQLAWRGADAERAFQRAYELSPDADVAMAYGRFKRYRGEYEEGIRLTQRAVELDPRSWLSYDQLAHVYRFARDNAAASAAYRKALELNPLIGAGTYVNLALAEAARGNPTEALIQAQRAEQFEPNTFRLSQLALVYSLAGRPEDAARVFAEFQQSAEQNPVSDAIWARAYLAIRDYDAAFERLESAVNNRISTDLATLTEIAANPWADPVLDEPRFRDLLEGLWEDG